jgi:hypothetical protein
MSIKQKTNEGIVLGDHTADEPGWFIINQAGEIGSGPYGSEIEAKRDARGLRWYDPNKHSIEYGIEGDDCTFIDAETGELGEDSSDFPKPGDNIRTRKTGIEGKVKKVNGNSVLFQLVDGRKMKTSIENVIVIEKLADEDDEIMEDELNEISNEVLARYKQGSAAQAGEADLKGDTKKADKRFSGIIKATKKQFANDKNNVKESGIESPHSNDPADTVTVDVPLLIRIMEYAKEDAKTDMDLHNVAEKLIGMSREGKTLTMDDYDAMVGDIKEGTMGGINRSAPATDVSYERMLDDVYDTWMGDRVKVKESYGAPLKGSYDTRLKQIMKSK